MKLMRSAYAIFKPERGVNETFSGYVARRKEANYYLKEVKRGTVFWYSNRNGTYRRPEEP